MAVSIIYRHALIYEGIMLALYRQNYLARLRAMADLIPAGASVLDLCCGPGMIYRRYLRKKAVVYEGLDINPGFIARLNSLGVIARVWDLHRTDELPKADYVLMQASLYHFLPDPSVLVNRMLRAANRQVIIAEPVRNFAQGRVPVLSAIARHHTNAGPGEQPRRFTRESLDHFFNPYRERIVRSFLIRGGREMVHVLEA